MLLQFEGGDRKGCEGCFIALMLHGAFGFCSLVVGLFMIGQFSARVRH
jgi:hypothetical protein